MARPVALITDYRKDAFPRILDQIAAGPRPPIADWYVWVTASPADRTYRYSP
jgi:hypothetical protein